MGFSYSFETQKVSPAPLDPQLLQTAKAYALWGSLAYHRELYRLPELKTELKKEPTTASTALANVALSEESGSKLIVD